MKTKVAPIPKTKFCVKVITETINILDDDGNLTGETATLYTRIMKNKS